MRSIWLAVFGLALSATAAADQVDFGLNNDAFAVRYSSERAGGTSSIDGEWYHHIDHGNVASAGFKIDQYRGHDRYSLGGKFVVISNDLEDASAIAVGGSVNIALPGEPRVRLGAHAWVAPAVTSFSDSDGFVDVGLRAGYRVLDRGEVYLAYRYIDVGYSHRPNFRVEDGLMLGMELSF